MKTPPARRWLLLATLGAAPAFAVFEAGTVAFTKRAETVLLAEPKPLAAPAGKIAYAHPVKVEEVQGAWLRVSEGKVAGWVFAGNLAATKPAEGGLDGLPLAASRTTATAAARPLDDAVVKYAEQRDLGSAKDDLEWLQQSCAALTPADVDHFLQEQKKGEFQ